MIKKIVYHSSLFTTILGGLMVIGAAGGLEQGLSTIPQAVVLAIVGLVISGISSKVVEYFIRQGF